MRFVACASAPSHSDLVGQRHHQSGIAPDVPEVPVSADLRDLPADDDVV